MTAPRCPKCDAPYDGESLFDLALCERCGYCGVGYCAGCLQPFHGGPAEEDSLTCEHCGHEHTSESQFLTAAQPDAQRREMEASWTSLSLKGDK